LHALQLLPIAAWLLRGLDPRRRRRMVLVTGTSYLALVVLLTWQALRGQSLTSPDELTMAVLGLWIVAFAFARPRANALETA
jgi:hypothetical protein